MKHRGQKLFNDGWEFQIDPYGTGLGCQHHRWLPEAESWAFLHGWKDTRTRKVKLPHTWNMMGKELWLYEGLAWYAKRFKAPAARKGRRVWLHLDGVNKSCEGWLNGEPLGEHFGGYTPFEWELTKHLQQRELNFVAVRVDARPTPDDPLPLPGWKNYAGIHREAALYTTGPVKVDWVAVIPQKVGKRSARAELIVELDGRKACELRIEIHDPSGKTVWSAAERVRSGGKRREWRKRVTIPKPKLWEPQHPSLYGITVTALVGGEASDTVEETFGVRRIETRGGKVLLNGKPIFLKGVNRHDEHPAVGRAVTPQIHKQDLRIMRRMGCNFVRLAHYPHHPHEVQLYDREGMLCWGEVPAVWAADFAKPIVRRRALSQLRELIRRDINRPSVVCWSVANEVHTTVAATRTYVKQAVDLVHKLDPSRPSTLACSNRQMDREKCLDLVDICGLNYYAGWYSGTIEQMRELVREIPKRFGGKPLIVSEFGSGSTPGLRGSADRKWTEDYHARMLDEQLAVIAAAPKVAGCTIWCFADFADPTRSNKKTEGFTNNKGLLTAERKPKLAFGVARRWYRQMP